MDYTSILNDKENEIVTLSKKIQNLENRLKAKNEAEGDLKKEVERLTNALNTVNHPDVAREDIDNLLISHFDTVLLHKQALKLKSKATASSHLMKKHLDELKLKGVKVDNEGALRALSDENSNVDAKITEDGVVHIVETNDRLVEVTLQDAKTKELVKQMGIELYKIYSKYPKVRE